MLGTEKALILVMFLDGSFLFLPLGASILFCLLHDLRRQPSLGLKFIRRNPTWR